jgi:hypothetical protein
MAGNVHVSPDRVRPLDPLGVGARTKTVENGVPQLPQPALDVEQVAGGDGELVEALPGCATIRGGGGLVRVR